MADLCCMVGCNSLGTKSCAACGVVHHCSAGCQKEDWKVHKHLCIDMNKLPAASVTFLSNSQVEKCMAKADARVQILSSKGRGKEITDALLKLLAFVENQFGVQVEGKPYCRRSNGELINNRHLINIRISFAGNYGNLVCDVDTRLVHAIKARQMLEYHDKSADSIIQVLADTERIISMAYCEKGLFEMAECHYERGMVFVRLGKGAGRIVSERMALDSLATIRVHQSRHLESVDLSEKSYILVSEAYGPVHPEVQASASHLFDCLIDHGEYSRADNYCRMNLENITDPRNCIDQEGNEVTRSMMQLADIWRRKPAVDDEAVAFALGKEAEEMARKSCLTGTRIDYISISCRYGVFGDVLLKRRKYTDETRMVLEWF